MRKIKHIFVINPVAGKDGKSPKLAEAICDACRAAGVDYEIYNTVAPGDASRFVRAAISRKPAGEAYRFYACGGDGTLSEVVNGAVMENSAGQTRPIPGVEVGCIPVGTGNDFVRNFSNHEFFLDVTKQILADSVVIDCYRCDDGRYGLNMINIGFDCEAAVKAAEFKKKKFLPNSFAYIAGVASVFKRNLGVSVTVSYDDAAPFSGEYQLVSAANGGFCGGGFNSAPKCSLRDGNLDISLIRKVTRFELLRIIGAYRSGKYLETKLGRRIVCYVKAKSVRFDFPEAVNVCLDGEILNKKSIELTAIPSSIAFVVPVGCEIID